LLLRLSEHLLRLPNQLVGAAHCGPEQRI
jgi:hypothetical protein